MSIVNTYFADKDFSFKVFEIYCNFTTTAALYFLRLSEYNATTQLYVKLGYMFKLQTIKYKKAQRQTSRIFLKVLKTPSANHNNMIAPEQLLN